MVTKKLTFRDLLTVEPVIFLYVYTLFMHGPVIQQFVYHKIALSKGFPYDASKHTGCANETGYNKTMKSLEEEVQSLSSYVQIGITMFQSVPALGMSLIVGSWSDTIGRKPAIILPIVGSTVEAVITILIIYLDLPVYVLFIGAACNGFFGYLTTLIMGIMSYIADTTDESKIAVRLAIMEAMVFSGGMVSQLTSGLWIKTFGFIGPYWFMLGCLALSFLYAVFILPESKPPVELAERTSLCSCNGVKRIWRVYAQPREGGRRNLFLLMLIDGLVQFGMQSSAVVMALYILHSPLCFSALFIGYFSGFRYFVLGAGAVLGIKVLGLWIDELNISRLGLLTTIASFTLFAFSNTIWMVFLVPAIGLLNGCITPIYKGMLSRIVSKDEQGALFSCVSSIETLFTLLGTFLFNSLYSYSLRFNFPGLVFCLVAGISFIPLLITCCLKNPTSLLSKRDRVEVLAKRAGYQPINSDDLLATASGTESSDDLPADHGRYYAGTSIEKITTESQTVAC